MEERELKKRRGSKSLSTSYSIPLETAEVDDQFAKFLNRFKKLKIDILFAEALA